jgi:Bacterial Ig-like domain (group 2)
VDRFLTPASVRREGTIRRDASGSSWSSNNTPVATVSSGLVSGVSPGQVTVTASITAEAGGECRNLGQQCPTSPFGGSSGGTVQQLTSFAISVTSTPVPGETNSVVSGRSAQVQVVAKDQLGDTFTGYTGTVHFSSTDTLAALPADYTYTASDAGSHTFSVTLKTVNDTSATRDLTVADNSAGVSSTENMNVWFSVLADVERCRACGSNEFTYVFLYEYIGDAAVRQRRCPRSLPWSAAHVLCGVVTAVALAALFVAPAWAGGARPTAQQSVLDRVKEVPPIRAGLREGMEEVAQLYRAPMLIVLKGDRGSLKLPAGRTTLRHALELAVGQNRGYSWEVRDEVIVFRHGGLGRDPENFLNWKLGAFTISRDVADVDLVLGAHIQNMRYHVAGRGGVVTALRDSDLAKHALPTLTLHDVTVANVVLTVLKMDRGFYSIIEFPGPGPLKDSDLDKAFASWRWVAFASKGEH